MNNSDIKLNHVSLQDTTVIFTIITDFKPITITKTTPAQQKLVKSTIKQITSNHVMKYLF